MIGKFDPEGKVDDDARSGIAENEQGEVITPLEAAIAAKDTKNMHREAERAQEILDERRKRAKEPVHMDGLKPLPPGVNPGGGPTQLQLGVPMEAGTQPSMRRSIPPPFKRKRIEIEHHGKSWAYLRAEQVRPGDQVVDVGLVNEVGTRVLHEEVNGVWAATGAVIQLWNNDAVTEVDPDEQVRVFRVHDS